MKSNSYDGEISIFSVINQEHNSACDRNQPDHLVHAVIHSSHPQQHKKYRKWMDVVKEH